MARFKTVNDIVNQVAVETGIPKQSDVFTATDVAFQQMIALSNSCGLELLQDTKWQGLVRQYENTTQQGDDGKYALPTDFAYMLNQTGWDRTNDVPLGGPLSAQEWTYLKGRDLFNQTIYASFRLNENQFWLFPQPPPVGLDITFEYISRNWVQVNGEPGVYSDTIANPSDVILYEPYLFERLLKLRFLGARGFDTMAAADQFNIAMGSWSGKDKGAPVLRAGCPRGGVPYLDAYRNTPDTFYGS